MKRLLVISILIAFVTVLSGCAIDLTGTSYQDHIYVDTETGVNYIILNSSSGVEMVPRYNSDGSLYLSKDN